MVAKTEENGSMSAVDVLPEHITLDFLNNDIRCLQDTIKHFEETLAHLKGVCTRVKKFRDVFVVEIEKKSKVTP